MTSESLCGAQTAAGGSCRRSVPVGVRCSQHASAALVALDGGAETPGERFRQAVTDAYELTDPEARILEQACATLDVVEALEAQVELDGTMVDGSAGQLVLHPAIGEARQQRLAFGRLVSQIDLPDPESETGEGVWTPQAVKARRAAQARWRRRGGA